jgi:SAM-dependent methyltransferase
MEAFLEWYRAGGNGSILDVGGTSEFWSDSDLGSNLTLLNVRPPTGVSHDDISYVEGTATELPFSDRSFDVVFSNSMIEHLGDRANQRIFAREARRVGRRLWIQTPNRWFPVEPHVLTPVVHYLPARAQRRMLRNATVWGWLTRPDQATVDKLLDELCLLTADDLRKLFPGSTLIREKVLGLTKSLIAVEPPGHRQAARRSAVPAA